jgi:hypothetical protein
MKSIKQKKKSKKSKSLRGGRVYSLYKILKEYKIAKIIDKKYGNIPIKDRKNCIQRIEPIDSLDLEMLYSKCRDPLIEDPTFYNNYCKNSNPLLRSKYTCVQSYAEKFIMENIFYLKNSINNRKKILEKDIAKIKLRQQEAINAALESGATTKMYEEMNDFYINILKKEEQQLKNIEGEFIDRHILLNLFISPEKNELLEDLYDGDQDEMIKDINYLLLKFEKYIIGNYQPIKKESIFF